MGLQKRACGGLAARPSARRGNRLLAQRQMARNGDPMVPVKRR